MKRKTFIKKTVGALLLAIPAYSLMDCSSSDDDSDNPNPNPNPTANCLQNGALASNITANHGHSLTVSKADIEAGVDKTYSVRGTADHDHEITVTAANFNTLKANMQIGVNSTTVGGHSHSITISCA